MANNKEILKNIEKNCNIIVSKLELLNMAEEERDNLENELKKIKVKLDDDEITKFSYATMLEANKKKEEENINGKKKTWDEIASIVNSISDKLNELKVIYNKKTEAEGLPEINSEETKKEETK
jgi:DNA polymerase II small subunit/DNA polymerase delta subunit B